MTILLIFISIIILKFILNLFRFLETIFCFYKFKKQPKSINEYAPNWRDTP
jgi:hypothetical protein